MTAMADAAVLAEEIMPDTGPGMQWYRELADEDAAPRTVRGE
jgi:hypothetical protein